MITTLIAIAAMVVFIIVLLLALSSRYKKCPSNRILVVYGKTSANEPSKCIHGGGTFIWPIFQGYDFLDLTPMSIDIPLQNALSEQNIRVSIPSTFTIGIGAKQELMQIAAQRLLGLGEDKIKEKASDIIFGQLRVVVAGLTIEQINADRDQFLKQITQSVTPELEKVGLTLINVNITDITDSSKYIESIGQKAAATAVNQAMVDVATQQKLGNIGKADNVREMNVKVAEMNAESVKGQKSAETDQRIFVQQKETEAVNGEKEAEAKRRIYVKEQEASAVKGENDSLANIAEYDATLGVKRATAKQIAEVALYKAEVNIQKQKQESELEKRRAEEVVPRQIEKEKIVIDAQAEKQRQVEVATGAADAIKLKYFAEAEGIKAVLEAKAQGYNKIMESCDGNANAAASFLMIEKITEMVKLQTEAIKNIKFGNINVWDSGGKTAEFASSILGSLPPLNQVAKMAGFNLPEFLGGATNNAPSVTDEKQ